jgi:hypothetical protein
MFEVRGRRYSAVAIALALGVMAIMGLTVRPGHNWDGDYALYIMHARNIVDGVIYNQTPFLANPENAIHPASYPPGLPLLLAPMYSLFGVDLDAMKWVGILSLAAWAVAYAHIAKKMLHWIPALAVTAVMSLHPYFWKLKDTIFSEFPFLLFTYATLLLADRLIYKDRFPAVSQSTVRTSIACILTLTLASQTRIAGVVLFPTLLLGSWLHNRRPVTLTVLSVATAIVLGVLLHRWLPSDPGTYLSYFDEFSVRGMLSALRAYAVSVGSLIEAGIPRRNWFDHSAIAIFLGLVVIGVVSRLRERVSVFELFLGAYIALLIAFPVHTESDRYSMPIWPLLMLYAARGVSVIGGAIGKETGRERLRIYLPVAMAAGFLIPYIYTYQRVVSGPFPYSVTSATAGELFDAIKAKVPPGDVVLARKPTIIALFTGRRASIWPETFSDDELRAFAHRIGAHYIVQDLHHFDVAFEEHDRLDAFIEANRSSLTTVFSNAWFNLYSIQ